MFANVEPIINVELPPAIVIPGGYLLLAHALLLCVDYLAIRYEHRLFLGPTCLRLILALVHVAMPLVFACEHFALNTALIGAPWFVASYAVHFASQPYHTLETWARNMVRALLAIQDNVDDHPVFYVRLQGLAKLCRGLFKWVMMKSVIDRWLLPADFDIQLLQLPYFSYKSCWLTICVGLKAYLMLGVVDIVLGVQQFLLGVPLMDLFDSPILAHSPRDFWSRRWNRIVHKLFHQQFFQTPSSRTVARGLFVFLISGIFHELMMTAFARRMTLEQVLFFMLHGCVVWAEVQLRRKRPVAGWYRVGCILGHLMFLTLTGRLFLAPYVRCELIKRHVLTTG